MPVQTVYELGRAWYGDRLRLDWQRPDAVGVEAAFASVGLTGPFWSMG